MCASCNNGFVFMSQGDMELSEVLYLQKLEAANFTGLWLTASDTWPAACGSAASPVVIQSANQRAFPCCCRAFGWAGWLMVWFALLDCGQSVACQFMWPRADYVSYQATALYVNALPFRILEVLGRGGARGWWARDQFINLYGAQL